MANFSNISLTNVDWDLTSNLSISEPYITSVTITATTFQSSVLTLPIVSSATVANNFTHGHTIVIRDPNGLLTGGNQIDIEVNAADTNVQINGAGTGTAIGAGTTSGILNIEYSGYNFFTVVDPAITPTGGSQGPIGPTGAQGATGNQGPIGPQGAQGPIKAQ